jgi:hypothetical protein
MAKARRGRRRTGPSAPAATGSLRAHWRADGQEKRRFPTADAANRAALQLRLEEGVDLDPYPCPYCNGWHLASRDR